MHGPRNWQLFAVCVLVWSTTWHAITYQIGVTTPAYGVAMRFAIAGAVALAWAAWRGDRLRLSVADHGWVFVQGFFMYGLSYICVYEGERHVPSGLVAVGFSASPLIGGLGARLLFGSPLSGRFLAGGVLCLVGVAMIFWPEFDSVSQGESAAEGALYTAASVVLSALGAIGASRNAQRAIPMVPALGYGMLYGALTSAAFVVARGEPIALPTQASWWIAMGYLAVVGSVLAFACYLTLLTRLGAGPAGAVGVMTPVLALVVSAAFEGYRPDLLALAGVAVAMSGNAMILRPARATRTSIKGAATAAE